MKFFIKKHRGRFANISREWLVIVEQDNGKKYVLGDFPTYERARTFFNDTASRNSTAIGYYSDPWEYLVGSAFKRTYFP
jgi:hypothetical protein